MKKNFKNMEYNLPLVVFNIEESNDVTMKNAQDITEKLNKNLKYYEVEIKDGSYMGEQFYVRKNGVCPKSRGFKNELKKIGHTLKSLDGNFKEVKANGTFENETLYSLV